jgi:hypothetical protein
MEPKHPDQKWHCLEDAYGSNLWDIQPDITVAGIGHDDTVIIDGCHAANVRWKCFNRVYHLNQISWKRYIASRSVHWSGYSFFLGCLLLVIPFTFIFGVFVLLYSLIMVLMGPMLLKIMYGGKFWGAQPWFFGFEGHLDIECIERQIFGAGLGRMQWSAFGSALSRHYVDENGEYVGVDPTTDPAIKAMVESGPSARPGDQRVSIRFTLFDFS